MVIYFAGAHTMRHRLMTLLNSMNVTAYEASSEYSIFKLIHEYSNGIQLIIYDADSTEDNGLGLLNRIRLKNRYIPILVLSSILKRSFYIESMIRGASDFLLKPFDDEAIVKKIETYLKVSDDEKSIEIITFDLSTYLKGEIRKAQKGNYPLSLMFATYYPMPVELKKNESQFLSQMVYGAMKSIFWETDVFLRFGKSYYIGVFPFCDESSTKAIKSKMTHRFEKLHIQTSELKEYTMFSMFVSYPNEVGEPDELIKKLIANVKLKLPNF